MNKTALERLMEAISVILGDQELDAETKLTRFASVVGQIRKTEATRKEENKKASRKYWNSRMNSIKGEM